MPDFFYKAPEIPKTHENSRKYLKNTMNSKIFLKNSKSYWKFLRLLFFKLLETPENSVTVSSRYSQLLLLQKCLDYRFLLINECFLDRCFLFRQCDILYQSWIVYQDGLNFSVREVRPIMCFYFRNFSVFLVLGFALLFWNIF
jgi:hypothetical protein